VLDAPSLSDLEVYENTNVISRHGMAGVRTGRRIGEGCSRDYSNVQVFWSDATVQL